MGNATSAGVEEALPAAAEAAKPQVSTAAKTNEVDKPKGGTEMGQCEAGQSEPHKTSADVPPTAPAAQATGTKLFQWVQAGRGGKWEPVADNAGIHFYDANEDKEHAAPDWHIEVDGAQDSPDGAIDASYEFEPRERRCSFVVDGSVWALQFPSASAFEAFCQRYNKALFENQYGMEASEENNLKVRKGQSAATRLPPTPKKGGCESLALEKEQELPGEGQPKH
jgi:hypothetical protein